MNLTCIHVLFFTPYLYLCLSFTSHAEIYQDAVFDSKVKTPVLYPAYGKYDDQLHAPIIPIASDVPLLLEFDYLESSYQPFYVKLIHCERDWQPSSLLESEYLREFINDFLITDYTMSVNTRIKYVHYRVKIPKVIASGNYIVKVYRDGKADSPILTRRCIVYKPFLGIKPDFKIAQAVEERFTHQQLDFTINYSHYPTLFNPADELTVVIRQNMRWDNAIYNLKPIYIKESDRILDYHYFNLENAFSGGNEFRQFDIRRIRQNSINIERIDFSVGQPMQVYIMTDKTRNGRPYVFQFDANGRFVTGVAENGQILTDPDYVEVHFDLKTDEYPSGELYVVGGFNDYALTSANKMVFNTETGRWNATLLLKQGYYNYLYAVKQKNTNNLETVEYEGAFSQTENFYDIILYHKPIGARADLVVGYFSTKFNAAR